MRRGKIGGRETANAGLEPYPDYKPSGVEWLGDAPAHWEMRRLKMTAENVVRQTRGRERGEIYIALEHVESWTGKIRKADPDAGFDSQVKQFRAGDVLFGKLRPYLAKVARPAESGACVGEFLVLRPRADNLTAGYLEQLLRSKPIIDAIDASTFGAKMPRADWRFIGNLVLPLPPPAEQAAIARYLGRVNERIHRCIDAGERLIGLLEEKRRAIIHHAVTRGLNPDVCLKPSGVEWLGDVPAHWEMRKLRSLFKLHGSGTTPLGDHYFDGDIPWIMIGDLNDGIIVDTKRTVTRAALDEYSALKMYPKNSLVIAMYGSIGKTGVLSMEACTNQACCVLADPLQDTNPIYIQSVMNIARHWLSHQGYGGVQMNISAEIVHAFRIPLPPLAEQAAIAAHLDKAVAVIDDAVAGACRWIELLREYRICLAANVVTGKLDVREAAATLPDGADEPAALFQEKQSG